MLVESIQLQYAQILVIPQNSHNQYHPYYPYPKPESLCTLPSHIRECLNHLLFICQTSIIIVDLILM